MRLLSDNFLDRNGDGFGTNLRFGGGEHDCGIGMAIEMVG